MFIALVTIGCGKKAEEPGNNRATPEDEPVLSDIELELSKQELFCGNAGRECPSYISKIAVLQKSKLKYCTGFLTKDNVVVTASSCLPDRLRFKDAFCDKDVTFFFATSDSAAKPLRMKCDKVLEISAIDTTQDPFLWRSNVAYLKVDDSDPKTRKELNGRKRLTPARAGMDDLDKFYTWTVDQIDSEQPGSHQGIIRKSDDCRAVHNTYFNPLSTNSSSPVITFGGCEYNEGNSGAPVLDYRGRVRGVVSRPVAKSEIDEVISMRILDRPLKSLMHVSNYACSPIYNSDETIQNESECSRVLDINSYDSGQTTMVNEATLFRTAIQKLEVDLNGKNRYLKFEIGLNPVGDAYETKVVVKCFKNTANWLNEYTNNKPLTSYLDVPQMKISKAMNEFGKIYASEVVEGKKNTSFQFKPSILRKEKAATVFMWSDGPSTTFYDVPESCPASLL